jgi:hypothetical protein
MTSLVQRRDYLVDQRRAIIARAVLGSLAGAVPVPLVDDWVVSRILGGGYRRIAASHHIDVTPEAVANLIHGTAPPTSIVDLAATNIAVRLASAAAKRMMFAIATVNRARSAARTFVQMTLFDHYCAKLHTGLALDGPTALELRDAIAQAIAQVPGALVFHPFRRGALAAARATLKAPLELIDLASRGAVRRLLADPSEVAATEQIDDSEAALAAALADKSNFLSRSVAAVELQLSADVNPYLEATIDAFDRRWRARIAAKGHP